LVEVFLFFSKLTIIFLIFQKMSLKFEKQNTVSDNNENNTHDFLDLHDNDNCYNQNNNTNANCNNDNKNNNNLEDEKDTAWMCQKCLKSNSSKHGNKCSCGFQNNFVKNDEKNSDVNPKQEKKNMKVIGNAIIVLN